MTAAIKVAVIGAGPAGIYASDILSKTDLNVSIDLFERLPAPYGLVRYGVAPDHPRIKQIIVALYKILQRGDIRLLGNVEIGRQIMLEELREYYDAIIVATGADRDRGLPIPGIDLPESYGAADFVSWYDGNPDYPRHWPLNAREIAIFGVGNVALDVARMLTKHVPDLLVTEIPANVAEGLAASPVTDVHVFGRRGPAQVKFTPLELRELGKVPDVDVVVSEEDFDFDEGSERALRASNQQRQVVKTLTHYASVDPAEQTASRRIHIHLFESPAEVLADADGHVCAVLTERTELMGDGTVQGTGRFTEWPVQAVYRAVGYYSSPLSELPFDENLGVIPNVEGRVLAEVGGAKTLPGVYATGWVKRGPVGLIGSTKSDAQQTIEHLVEDAQAGLLTRANANANATNQDGDAILRLLEERGVAYTTWHGWEILDNYEQALGKAFGETDDGRSRERVKVVSRETMTRISRGEALPVAEVSEAELVGEPGEMGFPPAVERFADYTGPRP